MGQNDGTMRGLSTGDAPDPAPPVSAVYECVVCQKDIIVPPGGKVRIEGILRGEDWAWGPYPSHERCRLDLRTPYDQQLGDGRHFAYGARHSISDPETAALLNSRTASVGASGFGVRVETPWPEFTDLLNDHTWRLAGLIAARGSKEATAGTWIAVHAAVSGATALLFTGYPPPLTRPSLLIDEATNPTPEDVARAIEAAQPDLVVIERWERMHHDEEVEGGRTDELIAIGDELMRVVVGTPTIVTTSIVEDIDLDRHLTQWTGPNTPAPVTMQNFCRPLLVLKRASPAEVDVRVERPNFLPENTQQAVAWKA